MLKPEILKLMNKINKTVNHRYGGQKWTHSLGTHRKVVPPPLALTDTYTHYCPGCNFVARRMNLWLKVIDELGHSRTCHFGGVNRLFSIFIINILRLMPAKSSTVDNSRNGNRHQTGYPIILFSPIKDGDLASIGTAGNHSRSHPQ